MNTILSTLFEFSVKENLNIGRVFQHLAERHIESVSRWSDESADEFSQPILQIGHHQQQTRDVRVRFANEHELNDQNNHKNPSSKGKKHALKNRTNFTLNTGYF